MTGRRDYIHELQAKLQFLARRTESGTWAELERYIPRSTRQQACSPNHPYFSLLGRAHQSKLAKAFGFDVMWEEWRDPLRMDQGAGRGVDTAEMFKRRFLREVSTALDEVGPLTPSEAYGADDDCGRLVLDEISVFEDVTCGQRQHPNAPLGTIAQLALDLGQPAGPGAHQLLVEVSCHRGKIIGSNRSFSVRNAVLALNCGTAHGRRKAIAGSTGLPVVLSNPNGDTSFGWSGTAHILRWDVTASGAVIGYLWFDVGVIEGLVHGNVLRVSLSAWLKHIDAEKVTEQSFGVLDSNGILLEMPEETLTTEQARIIEHLNKLKLPTDGNGYAELASHELQIVRKK